MKKDGTAWTARTMGRDHHEESALEQNRTRRIRIPMDTWPDPMTPLNGPH